MAVTTSTVRPALIREKNKKPQEGKHHRRCKYRTRQRASPHLIHTANRAYSGLQMGKFQVEAREFRGAAHRGCATKSASL